MTSGKLFFPRFGGFRDFGLFRIGGSGLANNLYVWAKAMVLARRLGGRVVFPTWTQVKLGPLLRREPDPRLYNDVFSPAGDDLRGLGRLIALARGARSTFGRVAEMEDRGRGLYVIDPSAFNDHFDELLDDRDHVRDELARRTRTVLPPDEGRFIGVHIRLGDFGASTGQVAAVNTRYPLEWYVDRIRVLREAAGERLPAVICSDGTPEELAEVLAEPDTKLRQGGTAMDDIWALSRAVAIVASGSTFSYWAGYLGDGLLVSRAGAWRATFTRDSDREWICGPEDRQPPQPALRILRGRPRDPHDGK